MVVHDDIERALEQRAGIYAVAEGDGKAITLSGLIMSESERCKALEIAAKIHPDQVIIDNLELVTAPAEAEAAGV